MTVELNINPTTITTSRIIGYNDGRAIVSFCVRFSVSDPARPGVIQNTLDTPLAVAIEFQDFIGITEILGNDVDQYGIESFLCDSQNKELAAADILPIAQGGRIRVCVQPDVNSRASQVVMKSINSFELQRGDVTQQILVANSVVKDPLLTNYVCTAGASLCSVEATLSNGFFYSDGTVGGVGEAVLQWSFNYGNRSVRRLKKVPIKPRQLQVPEPGGVVGSRYFTVSVEVEPSGEEYEAEAFVCDKNNAALEKSTALQPYEEAIRVCVRPNAAARARGVFIRRVASFRFQRDKTVQFAVDTGGRQADDGNTLLLCNPGDEMCVLKTTLAAAFYKGDGQVDGTGEVYLQFGRESTITSRRAKIRGLQITNSDSAFAGASEISFGFNVDAYSDKTEENWQDEAKAFWEETPTLLRMVYIVIVVLLVLIILCCAFFSCFGLPCGRQKGDGGRLEKRSIVQEQAPPMMVPRANSQIPVSPAVHVKEDDENVLLPLSPHRGKGNLRQGTGASPRRSTGEPQNSRQGVGSKSPKSGRRCQSMGESQNSKQGVGSKSPKPGLRRQVMGEPQNLRQGVGSKPPKHLPFETDS